MHDDPYQVEMDSGGDDAYEIFMGDDSEAEAEPQGRSSDLSMDVGLLASIAIEHIRFGKHVAEIYSPPG